MIIQMLSTQIEPGALLLELAELTHGFVQHGYTDVYNTYRAT